MAAVSQSALLAEPTRDSSPDGSPRRWRTIVVDDIDTFLKVTCCVLDLEDMVDLVAAASDGLEGIDTVTRLKPALVLMDVHDAGNRRISSHQLALQNVPAARGGLDVERRHARTARRLPKSRGVCFRPQGKSSQRA